MISDGTPSVLRNPGSEPQPLTAIIFSKSIQTVFPGSKTVFELHSSSYLLEPQILWILILFFFSSHFRWYVKYSINFTKGKPSSITMSSLFKKSLHGFAFPFIWNFLSDLFLFSFVLRRTNNADKVLVHIFVLKKELNVLFVLLSWFLVNWVFMFLRCFYFRSFLVSISISDEICSTVFNLRVATFFVLVYSFLHFSSVTFITFFLVIILFIFVLFLFSRRKI